MKAIKTVAIATLSLMLMSVSANAWGKKEQGILIGVGSALLLPALVNSGRNSDTGYYDNRYYQEPRTQYVQQPAPYIQPSVQYVQPQVQYIQAPADSTMQHRQPRQHTYINGVSPGQTVIIEHSDGTRTIVEGR